MSRFRSVPFWPTLIGLTLICGAAITCRKEAADAINDNSLWTRADGLPMDHAGNLLKCPNCGGVAWFQGDYRYRCEAQDCRLEFTARYRSETGEVRIER